MSDTTKAGNSRLLSPELERRIDALSGCQGYWVLIRDEEPESDCSHQWHQSPDEHLKACLADRWRSLSLGFVPSYIGFSDYSNTGLVGLANYRVFTDPASVPDPHDAIHEIGYGWNGAGVCVDLRYATDDMLETIQALESYPLISDDEHSQLECEVVEKDWAGESVADRVRTMQHLGFCIFAARDDSAPWRDSFDRLREYLLSCANEYPTAYA